MGREPEVEAFAASVGKLTSRLLSASSRLLPDDLGSLLWAEATAVGFSEAAIFLVDVEQRVLTPLPPRQELSSRDVETTLAGRAFQLESPFVGPSDDRQVRVWIPLIDGAERLGVLHLGVPGESDEVLETCRQLASLVAELVVAKTQYGDALVSACRTRSMTLAAELRWSNLPPLTFTGPDVGIACVLGPAYEVAGDAFDYAINGDLLHLAIVDAMGHGLEASRMANLAITAYRYARRRGDGLEDTYRIIDEAIQGEFPPDRFVTGQLATLDARCGLLRWVNAGHPPPLLLRDGRVSLSLTAEPWLPFGMDGVPLTIAEHTLQPGDRLLFFTDGVVETRSSVGDPFGMDRLVELTRRAMAERHTLAETVRRLARSVLEHQEVLEDDATILLVDWHPARTLV